MPRRDRLARGLLRLYPRAWRARYEDEVLALVEETGLGWRQAIDLGLGAIAAPLSAGPLWWALTTLCVAVASLTVAISRLASAAAMWLTAHVATPPVIWTENGQTLVRPALWPGAFGFLVVLVPVLVIARVAVALGASLFAGKPFPGRSLRIHPLEFCGWMVVVWLGSTGWQWSALVGHLGTGMPARPSAHVRADSALQVLNAVMLLCMASHHFLAAADRQLALREASKVMPPKQVLGL